MSSVALRFLELLRVKLDPRYKRLIPFLIEKMTFNLHACLQERQQPAHLTSMGVIAPFGTTFSLKNK